MPVKLNISVGVMGADLERMANERPVRPFFRDKDIIHYPVSS